MADVKYSSCFCLDNVIINMLYYGTLAGKQKYTRQEVEAFIDHVRRELELDARSLSKKTGDDYRVHYGFKIGGFDEKPIKLLKEKRALKLIAAMGPVFDVKSVEFLRENVRMFGLQQKIYEVLDNGGPLTDENGQMTMFGEGEGFIPIKFCHDDYLVDDAMSEDDDYYITTSKVKLLKEVNLRWNTGKNLILKYYTSYSLESDLCRGVEMLFEDMISPVPRTPSDEKGFVLKERTFELIRAVAEDWAKFLTRKQDLKRKAKEVDDLQMSFFDEFEECESGR